MESKLELMNNIEKLNNENYKLKSDLKKANERIAELENKTTDDIENFICYLIDNCEGNKISEEGLIYSIANFVKSDKYNTSKVKFKTK
jgi:hypothetical protein